MRCGGEGFRGVSPSVRPPPFFIVCSASRRQRRGLETHKGEEAISTATVAELAADELGLVAFLREREERLRVRRGRPPLRHRLGPLVRPRLPWSPRQGLELPTVRHGWVRLLGFRD